MRLGSSVEHPGVGLPQIGQLWRWVCRHKKLIPALGVGLVFGVVPTVFSSLGITPEYHSDKIGDGGLPIGGLFPQWHTGISGQHWLGLEPQTGRDLLLEILYAGRLSLGIALAAAVISVFLGTIIGVLSGYFGGVVDLVLGRIIDLTFSFPQLLFVICLSPIVLQFLQQELGLASDQWAKILFMAGAFGLFGWPYLARLVRGQVLSIRELDYIAAAKLCGATPWLVIRTQILPGLGPLILVYTSLAIPTYISAESALAFLNIGISEPTPTWGKMLDQSLQYTHVAPLYLLIPGISLLLVILAIHTLGLAAADRIESSQVR